MEFPKDRGPKTAQQAYEYTAREQANKQKVISESLLSKLDDEGKGQVEFSEAKWIRFLNTVGNTTLATVLEQNNLQYEFDRQRFLHRIKSNREQKPESPSWNPKKSPEYVKNMANKFLPFIVENSTPISIFKTLMSRSKGMNNVTLASVFSLVLDKPIAELRHYVKELPDMALEKIYEALIEKYPSARIDAYQIKWFHSLMELVTGNYEEFFHEDLKQFPIKDLAIFIVGTVHCGRFNSEYSKIPFDGVIPYDEETKAVLNNLTQYVKLSDTGTPIFIYSRSNLNAFLIHKALIEPRLYPDKEEETYNLILGKDPKEDDDEESW